jgi:hypothetical protein
MKTKQHPLGGPPGLTRRGQQWPPEHPEHPPHPDHPDHPDHPQHPEHPEHPPQPDWHGYPEPRRAPAPESD